MIINGQFAVIRVKEKAQSSNAQTMNHVVIMAGGIGSRFWPISTPEKPKQFIDVLGCGRTLVQLTVDRFKGICHDEDFWVVTNEKYVDIVKEQLPSIPASHILAEPAMRNTAPCIAWACWSIYKEDSEANIVVTPADAVVMNPVEFQRVVRETLAFTAERNAIVTLGIKPNRPETGYGYVQASEVEEGEIRKVTAFKEKPDLETAETYLSAGHFLWNAGIFVWNVKTVVQSIRKYKPQLAHNMDRIMQTSDVQTIFPTCEKVSIDYAVMEPAATEGIVYTYPSDFGWSDLGNWQSLHEKLQKDEENNAVVGKVKLYECRNCVVHAEDANSVVLQGLEDYIISEKDGRLLVCKRSEEQRIKDFSQL